MTIFDTAYELAFPRVLEAVAQGATYTETLEWVGRMYPALDTTRRAQLLTDALDDAMSCGIERDDIDPSWF